MDVREVTDDVAVLALMGPRSRAVLGRVLDGHGGGGAGAEAGVGAAGGAGAGVGDEGGEGAGAYQLSNDNFPFGTAKTLTVITPCGRGVPVLALRVS